MHNNGLSQRFFFFFKYKETREAAYIPDFETKPKEYKVFSHVEFYNTSSS